MNTKIDRSKVTHVYSGRHGCACGCRGKHSYASSVAHQGVAVRGYEFTPEDISDKNITRVVNFINDNIEGADDSCGMVVVETPTRVYIAYLE